MNHKIKDNVYAVSVLNPALRIFDIVMTTDYGTTYNSYIVKGTEKTALIEVNHASFFENYLDNIKEICKPEDIDYIILNHCEPDHSGALRELLDVCPNAKIIVTKMGGKYIDAICNRADMPVQYANDNEPIDLGGKTLKFFTAPMLHWPDSMFTWCEEDKILYSCDFLGSHYCEPYILDKYISDNCAYEKAFLGYYNAIFGPFKKFVRAGLDKIKSLDIETVCSSHGPVLTKGGKLEYAMEKYAEWSAEAVHDNPHIPVFYCSAYGNTKKLAEEICKGVKSVLPNAECDCYNMNCYCLAEMAEKANDADAMAFGSPTINADAVGPIWNLLACVDALNAKTKSAAVFGSYGWSGEAIPNITARLEGLKMKVIGSLKANFTPDSKDLENAFELGKALADSIKR